MDNDNIQATAQQLRLDLVDEIRRSAEIFKVWADWSEISFDERLRIAQLANEVSPESIRQQWEEDIKAMTNNPFYIPTAVQCYVGYIKGRQLTGFINEFISRFQLEGNAPNSAILQYIGEKIEQLEELKKRLEDYRRDSN